MQSRLGPYLIAAFAGGLDPHVLRIILTFQIYQELQPALMHLSRISLGVGNCERSLFSVVGINVYSCHRCCKDAASTKHCRAAEIQYGYIARVRRPQCITKRPRAITSESMFWELILHIFPNWAPCSSFLQYVLDTLRYRKEMTVCQKTRGSFKYAQIFFPRSSKKDPSEMLRPPTKVFLPVEHFLPKKSSLFEFLPR